MKRRFWQMLFVLLSNASPGFLWHGGLYRGWLKGLCFPGLNCYSCPAALFACPLGSLQQALAAVRVIPGVALKALAYVVGFLFLFGFLFGRVICGWFCPFGFLQELLFKIPTPKFSLPRTLRYTKFVILGLLVLFLPLVLVDNLGQGEVWFCRLLCPAGTLEAGVFNLLLRPELRSLVSLLFYWKLLLLFLLLGLSVVFFRFFCAVFCPLGAIYGFFNRLGLIKLRWETSSCLQCRLCEKVCPLGLKLPEELNSMECIRCLQCLKICPTKGIQIISSGQGSFKIDSPPNFTKSESRSQ